MPPAKRHPPVYGMLGRHLQIKSSRIMASFSARSHNGMWVALGSADMPKEAFRVAVLGDEIVVTMPGSTYSVTYYKRGDSPQLLARYIANEDDPRFRMTAGEFLGTAWKLANEKARQLGWVE